MTSRLRTVAVLSAIAFVLVGCGPKKDNDHINSGRIIEKNHYLQGEYRECKKSIFPDDKCELGDPVQFPERCTYLIEEYETHRKEEVEVGCDETFNNAVIGSAWTRPSGR